MPITENYSLPKHCKACGQSLPKILRGEQKILAHRHWSKDRPLNPIFGKIDMLKIGECVVIPNESRSQYASMTCFTANEKFYPKRFTSRYDKMKKEGYIYRVEPNSKYDGKLGK